MKKKILFLITGILLIASLFLLTACGDSDEKKEKSESKSSGKKVIEDFAKYYNDKDKKIADLFDIDSLQELIESSEFSKSDVEAVYKYVFDEYDNVKYKIDEIIEVKNKEDLKKVLEKGKEIDAYDETEIDDSDIDDIYSAMKEEYEDYLIYYVATELNGEKRMDQFVINKDDEDYKIVFCTNFAYFFQMKESSSQLAE